VSGLDDILGGLMGGKGGLDDVLGGLTGGRGGSGMSALLPVVGGLLASGGLSKIMGGLKANGLAEQADSWVGTGPNKPVTGSQVEQAAGKEQIQQIAQQLGVSESQAADAVATVLPEVAPEGKLPPDQDLDAAFDKLAQGGAS
jgi:uncharacterized protein YidB (DUF937 family)